MEAARLSRGLTLEALAQRCTRAGAPVSRPHLGRIVSGKATPRPELRLTLAVLLDLDPVTLRPLDEGTK